MPVPATDLDVQRAIQEHADWLSVAIPSAPPAQPRVAVYDGEKGIMRRPFKKDGVWWVRWAGTARLVDTFQIDGGTAFKADWGGQ